MSRPAADASAAGAPGWRDAAPDPLWSRADVRFVARFRCLGLTIEARAASPQMLALVAEAFGPADARARGDSLTSPRVDLALTLVHGPPPGGDGWPVERRIDAGPSGPPLFREHDGLFVAFDGAGGCVTADLRSGVAVAWVAAGAASNRVRTMLVETPLWRLAAWRGLAALHAAAVVVRNVAVVVRGAPGAGKSSIALAADLAGRAVLAEEVVWIDSVTWSVRPATRRIHFDDEAAMRLAGGRAADSYAATVGTTADPPGDKVAVPLTTRPPVRAVPIGPLVLLGDPGDPSATAAAVEWRPVEASAARVRCGADRIVGEHAQPEERWRAVVDKLCDRGAYELRGGDPAARSAALDGIVRDWRGRGGALRTIVEDGEWRRA